eukprot:CAMPEP_0179297754 /NCGR_PEP_ID=MMETSP0797-20121207/45634_1 /TAXON_ID=47934 /ORGANISM="Dinophysis acuminata, Strain DAEP01" /LENGTH=44 /DNA_ID= /DNA_START= /DNA_END= /DNA_ORIENTATION=
MVAAARGSWRGRHRDSACAGQQQQRQGAQLSGNACHGTRLPLSA